MSNYRIGLMPNNEGSVGDIVPVYYRQTYYIAMKFPEGWKYFAETPMGVLSQTGVTGDDYIVWNDGDTTPSIKNGFLFKTNNSSSTTITFFDNPPSKGVKWFGVIAGDSNTIIAHDASNLKLSGGINLYLNTDDNLMFFWDKTKYIEFGGRNIL